jgi:hypothetical protein
VAKQLKYIIYLHRLTLIKIRLKMKINFEFMKYFVVIILFFVSFSANAQTRFPDIDSAKNYVLRYIKNSAVESFTNWRMQNVTYGTLELLDSLAGGGAIDSIWKNGDTLKYSKLGVNYIIGTVGGSIPTLQQVTNAGNTTTIDTVALIKSTNRLVELVSEDIGEGQYAGKVTARSQGITRYGELFYDGLKYKQSDSIVIIRPPFIPKRNNINIYFPDTSGYLINAVVSNGIKYDGNANGIANIGNTDTATVVKAYVTNAEAVTITKGQVVYIYGASGDRASVRLAKNTSDTFSSKTLGIVRADIAAGQAGWVTTQGQVSGINLGAYTAGDILWLDSVAGGFTKVKPEAPYHSVFVGVVERANAGNGLIYVKPQNGQELDELHNVKITSPKSGDAITYTPASQIWENRQVVLKQDTIPLAVFNVGSAAAGDTAAFSTSTLAGSFYLDGTDTMFVTSYRVALQGTSASITPEVWFNDSLNVTAGGTRLATGSAITNLTTGTSVTPDTNKIPPGNFVFVRFSAITTKPTYFTLTLFGYRIRKQ